MVVSVSGLSSLSTLLIFSITLTFRSSASSRHFKLKNVEPRSSMLVLSCDRVLVGNSLLLAQSLTFSLRVDTEVEYRGIEKIACKLPAKRVGLMFWFRAYEMRRV